jgi:hypothetical protein
VRLGTDCVVHRHTSAVPLESHHIFPLGDGGPNIAANRIIVCANGHYEIHACLDLQRVAALTWRQKISFGRKVRMYAALGWLAIERSKPKPAKPWT